MGIWVVVGLLVLAALVALVVLVYDLVGRVSRLTRTMTRAAEQVGQLSAAVESLHGAVSRRTSGEDQPNESTPRRAKAAPGT